MQKLSPEEELARRQKTRARWARAQATRRLKASAALQQVHQAEGLQEEVERLRAQVVGLESALTVEQAVGAKPSTEHAQEIKNLRAELEYAWSEVDRLKKELCQAEKAIQCKVTLAAPDASKRAKILLEKMVTRSLNKSWEVTRAADQLASVIRQTKAARTALAKVQDALKPILTEGEADILGYASLAVGQIVEAAELAKEQGRRVAASRKAHEDACSAAAQAAIQDAFAAVMSTIEGQVLVAAWKVEYPYDEFHDLVKEQIKAPARTLQRAVREALDRLQYAVERGLKTPQGAAAAAQALLEEFQAARPQLAMKYGAVAQRLQAELVALQPEKANAQRP